MDLSSTLRSPAAALVAALFASVAHAQCELNWLLAPDAQPNDGFGASLAVDGNVGFIGAWRTDDQAPGSGSVYVVERSATGWLFTDELHASDGAYATYFGRSVCIDGDRALVGAADAAYVFERTPSGWTEVAKLVVSSTEPGDSFSAGLALQGDLAVVGAPYDHNSGMVDRGSVYVFQRTPAGWSQISHLVAADGAANDHFGADVALSGDVLAVGAPGHGSAGAIYVYERGLHTWGTPTKASASGASLLGHSVAVHRDRIIASSTEQAGPHAHGAAYVFRRLPSGWVQEARFIADEPVGNGYASDVDLAGNRAVVGAYLTGESGKQAGRIYVYTRTDSGWRLDYKFMSAFGEAGTFARRVAVSGDAILASSYLGGTFCNPNCSSGAAYAFSLPLETSYVICSSAPNSTGSTAALTLGGCTDVSRNELSLRAHPVPANTSGIFFYGDNRVGPLPFGDGSRCVGGRVFRLPMSQANGDELTAHVDLNAPRQPGGLISAGSTWYFQSTYRDTAAGAAGFNQSEALEVLFQN